MRIFRLINPVGFTYLTISFIVFCIIFTKSNISMNGYYGLFLAPFLFFAITLVTIKGYYSIKSSVVVSIITFGYFVKLVLFPLLFTMGGCKSYYLTSHTLENQVHAIAFLAAEYLICMLAINLCRKNYGYFYKIDCNSQRFDIEKREFREQYLFLVIFLLLVLVAIAYVIVPNIQTIFYPFYKINFSDVTGISWDNETIVARGGIQRYVYSIFTFLFPLVRFTTPVILIYYGYSKFGENNQGLAFSAICLCLPFVILGGDNLAPFICVGFELIVITRLFKHKSKVLLGLVGVLAIVGIVVIAGTKVAIFSTTRGANGIAAIAQIINAYFPGIDNVAIAISIERADILETFKNELFAAIPFSGTVVGSLGENVYDFFTKAAGINSQIPEWGTNISFFVGELLSLVISFSIVYYIQKLEIKAKFTKDFWQYFICEYFAYYTAASIIIYSSYIYLRFLFYTIIPLIIILKISGVKKGKYFSSRIYLNDED